MKLQQHYKKKPGNSAEVDAMQRIQDKLQTFFSITAEYDTFQVNQNTAKMIHDALNRYKNGQLGKNFDKNINVQLQTVYYWQKVVCKPTFIEKLYIGFVSSLNKSATYHVDVFDTTYIDNFDVGLKGTWKTIADKTKYGPNIIYSEKLYSLIMDHLFENLRAEFAKYGILPVDSLKFGENIEFIYLLFNTCTKLIDGKPLNVRNTDNFEIDPTSDSYKNKIIIPSQNGKDIPDFIQDKDVNPYFVENVEFNYNNLTNHPGPPIYFENKETLVNACKLFLFLYRKKTCTKYMKKTQSLDKEKYSKLNINAPQEISFIEEWTKVNASGGQISKEAYGEMLAILKCRNNFKSDISITCDKIGGPTDAGGPAGISAKDALDNTLISLNIMIPTNPPDNQTYRLCKISGMPPMLGSPEMLDAAKKAKLTASLGEDANITDADRAIQQKSLDDAAVRNAAAIAEGEKFTNIQPKLIEGMNDAASSNQIENLFTGIVNDVKLFFGYVMVMILVFVLCYSLMTVSPAAFSFLSTFFVFLLKNLGDIATILFTGLGLSLTGIVDILSGVAVGLTTIVSMILNICFSVFKDFAFAIYAMISVSLYSIWTIIFAGMNYITQQVLNFAELTFGTSSWLGASGFNFVYQQTLSFVEIISTTSNKALIYMKDQIMNFLQVSSGTGVTFFDILWKLILLFFTILFTLLSTIVTLLLSSIAFILNFFLGTTTNIVQTLYNYSSTQIDLFIKMAFGSGSSLFKIVYELILLIGKLIFASLYTFVEVLLSVITALMRLILGTSGGVMDMIINFFTLISTLLKNVGYGIFIVIYDIFSFLGKTIGTLPSMSFTYVANLFANVFSKYNNVSNPSE